MRILAIESSCDETGAAIIEDGRFIRSNVVASQASIHERYGGVVPEVASRQQVSALIPVLESALREAELGWQEIDAIAATFGPGLAGSLLVGLTAGKALALARGLPFLGVNHLEAHIYANWLRTGGPFIERPLAPATDALALAVNPPDHLPGDPQFPLLALVISGAHSELVYIPQHGRYELLGQTRDDAAGEAFDKVARLLGLGYPGGPAIERATRQRDAQAKNPWRLPRAWMRGTYDFSFSGLKTAMQEILTGAEESPERITSNGRPRKGSRFLRAGLAAQADGRHGVSIPDLAAAFQESVVDVLATKTAQAARELGVRQVVLAGGVAANLALRERLATDLAPLGVNLRYPPVALCTDNAAMIGAAAYFHLRLGERSDYSLDVRPGLQLPFAATARA